MWARGLALACVIAAFLAVVPPATSAAPLKLMRTTAGIPASGCPSFSFADDTLASGVMREGDAVTCDVVLKSAPSSDVTLTFFSNQDRLRFEPASMTFTPTSWSVPQRVTAAAVSDEWQDPTRSYVAIEAGVTGANGCGSSYLDDSVTGTPSAFASKWNALINYQLNNSMRIEPPISSALCAKGDVTPSDRRALRLGIVQILEPQAAAFEVSKASALVDREGGAPAAIWVRPTKRPRARVDVGLGTMHPWVDWHPSLSFDANGWDRYNPRQIISAPPRARFSPSDWQTFKPLPWGREQDRVNSPDASTYLSIGMRTDLGIWQGSYDLQYHTAHAWPPDDCRVRLLEDSLPYPCQRVRVRVLDDDRTTKRGFYVRAFGTRSFDSSVPDSRLSIYYGCTQQKRTYKRTTVAREWLPAPTQSRQGKPIIGFQATLLARGASGPWRVFARTKLVLHPQDYFPLYAYHQGEIRHLPAWVKAARVSCKAPRGTTTFSQPIPLYRTAPQR